MYVHLSNQKHTTMKKETINFRVTATYKADLQRLAQQKGVSVTTYIILALDYVKARSAQADKSQLSIFEDLLNR